MDVQNEESFENLEKEYTFRIDEHDHDHDTAEEETLTKSMSSIRWHAIGIGLLIGVLGAVLVTVFVLTFSEDPKEPTVLVSSMGEVKTRPAEVGGLDIPDQDKLVYQRMRSSDLNTAVVQVVNEEEKPLPPPIIPMEDETPEIEEVVVEIPVVPEEKVAEPAPVVPVAEAPIVLAPVEETAPVPQPVKPAVVEKKTTEVVTKTETKTATKTETKPVAKAEPKWRVQLASMSSKADAEKAWNPLVKKHSVVLSGVSHQVIKATTSAKKTVYRLVAGEFATKKEAQDFCAKLKSRGQDCLPVQ